MKLTFSLQAQSDLEDIFAYGVRHWGNERADEFILGMQRSISILVDQPGIGRPALSKVNVPKGPKKRVYLYKGYKIIYSEFLDEIYISTVLPPGSKIIV